MNEKKEAGQKPASFLLATDFTDEPFDSLTLAQGRHRDKKDKI